MTAPNDSHVLKDKGYKRPLIVILWILVAPIAILAIVLCVRALTGSNIDLWGLTISRCHPDIRITEVPVSQKTMDSLKTSIEYKIREEYSKLYTAGRKLTSTKTPSTKVNNQGDVKNQNNGTNYGQVGDNIFERELNLKQKEGLLTLIRNTKLSMPTITSATIYPYPGAPQKVVAQIAELFREEGYQVSSGIKFLAPGEQMLHGYEVEHNETQFSVYIGDLIDE